MAEPHPQNVPGPFYVENGCCLSCNVPFEIAPELFDWEEGGTHCFVSRQPCDPKQLDRMLYAMWSSEVDCIRYRGTDSTVTLRIAEFGHKHSCDFPAAPARHLVRAQVRFRSSVPGDSPLGIAGRFRAWVAAVEGYPGLRYRVRKPRWWNPQSVIFSWEASITLFPALNQVRFQDDGEGRMRATLRSGRVMAGHILAMTVHEWLDETEGATEIYWFSREDHEQGAPGFHMPI